jgi:shikimate dehydrogenase
MGNSKEALYKFGLIGRNIGYSFSRGYFSAKFAELGLKDYSYENFDLNTIAEFKELLRNQAPNLFGLNVTIPYKEAIIPFLDELDAEALQIGAVNTIRIKEGKTQGFNTDLLGFKESLRPLLRPYDRKALILGTGGASKAIARALEMLNIAYTYVSRNPSPNQIAYSALEEGVLEEHTILVQCTPLGTFPDIEKAPDIPYHQISSKHLLYDLIYNPDVTEFLRRGRERGARTKNGLEMLQIQAEEAWKLWNS